jgi:hypothetical protein
MPDVLQECGEKLRMGRIIQLFKEYTWDRNDTKCASWKEFMDVMNHIKKDSLDPNAILNELLGGVTTVLDGGVVQNLLGKKSDKLGKWEITYNSFAEKNFYYNTVTKEKQWDLPDEVRFYIPPKLLDKLLLVFDYGHLENFKYQFTMIDVDNSGDITEVEMKLLLKSMGLAVVSYFSISLSH